MATKTDNSSQILKRLERLESKLFGNGESLLERVTRLETGQQILLRRIEEYHLSRKKDLEEAILKAQEKTNELLNKQVTRAVAPKQDAAHRVVDHHRELGRGLLRLKSPGLA
jgi:16S rRNA U1498 N3-methylase RsmE